MFCFCWNPRTKNSAEKKPKKDNFLFFAILWIVFLHFSWLITNYLSILNPVSVHFAHTGEMIQIVGAFSRILLSTCFKWLSLSRLICAWDGGWETITQILLSWLFLSQLLSLKPLPLCISFSVKFYYFNSKIKRR